jgi:hypothetical protein
VLLQSYTRGAGHTQFCVGLRQKYPYAGQPLPVPNPSGGAVLFGLAVSHRRPLVSPPRDWPGGIAPAAPARSDRRRLYREITRLFICSNQKCGGTDSLADELSHRAAGVWGPRFPAAHLNATLSDQFRHERLQIAATGFALGHRALTPVPRRW